MPNQDPVSGNALLIAENLSALEKYARWFARRAPVCFRADVYASCMLAATEAAESYDPVVGASFVTHAVWQMRAARTKLVRHEKREKWYRITSAEDADTPDTRAPDTHELSADMSHQLHTQRVAHWIMAQLDARDRRIVVAAADDGAAELARELGVSRQAVASRLGRIRRKLQAAAAEAAIEF